ncbi:hypothetical protein [Flavobacterium sp. XGLA_31]|uniref:hypothetical protein n=1 Tax=Flavobacterium sp. XGLA_31 TaxID=3447666 RepID=UPI003F4022DE
MKKLFFVLCLAATVGAFAQKPCEIDVNVSDSLGTYKTTKQQMIFERSFAGNSTNIFFSLSNTNGVLAVEMQSLQKSNDFIKANCLDAGSKIYLQLNNGKIVMLIYSGADTCGTLVRDEKNSNNRILVGTFLFTKENYEELKLSPVTFMRIKYSGETIDYPFKTMFVSELDQKQYEPEKYFIENLKCIEN